MPRVVFVAPFALDTTLRFARAAAELSGVHFGLISQEPLERVPDDLRRRVSAFRRVKDGLDERELGDAVSSIAREWQDPPERLIGVLEQLQVPLARVRERLKIRGMDSTEAHNFRDKARMKDVLRENGVPCARHLLAHDAAEAAGFCDQVGFPVVVKPPAGAGARHTFRVDNKADLEGYLRSSAPTDSAPVLLEEFVTGREYSFDTVTLHRRHVFHSMSRYVPSPLEVLQSPWIQWCVILPQRIDTQEFSGIVDVGRRALDALGMVTGVTHMEWFRRADDSIVISEVAARPPGAQFSSLISFAHDFDLYRAWARLMIHESFDVPERQFACGAAYLRGQGTGEVVAIEGWEQARAELRPLIVEAKLPELGQRKSESYEGDGYVIVRHQRTDVVERALRLLIENVRIQLGRP